MCTDLARTVDIALIALQIVPNLLGAPPHMQLCGSRTSPWAQAKTPDCQQLKA